MSVFKEHRTSADRSASDRGRHKHKIEEAIREGIYHVIADESIIGKDGTKKVRIPVRGIKEYQFVYGDNEQNKKVGSATGKNIKRGQQVGPSPTKEDDGAGPKPGNEKGVEYYEVEITLEELAYYLFESLELPELEKKRMRKIMSEKMKRHGYREFGIRPRLDKKKTLRKKLRRKAASKRAGTFTDEEDDRFPFHSDDLKYKHIKNTIQETSNAVVFFVMDISGSMTQQKKFLARSFYFLLYQFLNYRYENVDLVFIAHDTQAYEVTEDQFFKRGAGGGTLASSSIEMALNIINERYPTDIWNIYAFHCSDGDNWPEDMTNLMFCSGKLKELTQLYCYCEIEPNEERMRWLIDEGSKISNAYAGLDDDKFKIVKIQEPGDIWPAFQDLFGGKLGLE
jgi:sporulation protein YhbH